MENLEMYSTPTSAIILALIAILAIGVAVYLLLRKPKRTTKDELLFKNLEDDNKYLEETVGALRLVASAKSAELEKTEAALKRCNEQVNSIEAAYINNYESVNKAQQIMQTDLVAWDGAKVYKTFEYGRSKKAEVIASKDRKSYRKPVKVGFLLNDKFIGLSNLIDEIKLLDQAGTEKGFLTTVPFTSVGSAGIAPPENESRGTERL